MTFIDLGIEPDIAAALEAKGICEPFPIQEQTIPLALSGQDIIGQAKTGTGKTFGFGLPLIQRLGVDPEKGVKALIVVPTRELAVQVTEDMELATANRETSVAAIYGGKAYEDQIEKIKAGAQIIVGTPGRLLDLAGQRLLSFSEVEVMVLDEADEMLDLGFLPDVEKLFAYTPDGRQTMLFSATMPGTIVTMARKYQNRPVHIRTNDPDEGQTKADIKQFIYRAHALDKDEVVGRILQAEGRGKTVIFTKTKRQASKVSEELVDRGFNATALHGDMTQEAREKSMAAFRSGKRDILVATEVAARGIDVDDVTHVINYTIPEDEKAYLHRVGRTGRAGRTGIAVTFVDWEDLTRWGHINTALEFGQPEPTETYSSSAHLFADLEIAPGTKGRIAKTKRPEGWKPGDDEKPRGGNSRGGANSGRAGGQSGRGHKDGANRGDKDRKRGGDRPHKATGDAAKSETPRAEKHGEGEHKRPPRQRNRTKGGKPAAN